MLAENLGPGCEWTQATLGAELGVTRQAVSYWADGTNQPSPDNMGKLEDLMKIPMRAWTRKPRKKTGTHG